ncbi:MAG: heparinase II/III domain-containing protein [Armatimonadota bacterium]
MPTTDLWGVWRDLDRIKSNTRHPLFADFWQTTLTTLESALASPLTTEGSGAARVRSVSEIMQSHALAYPLTGDDRQAERALEALEIIRTEPCEWNFIEHNEMYPQDTADLMTAEITKSCASTVSWLWPLLTDTQRHTYLTMIADRGGQPIYNGAKAGCWWGNALNSNWTAVLNSGLAFAALLPLAVSDSPLPQQLYRKGEGLRDPQGLGVRKTWLAFARARTLEMLDLAAEEAAGIEGAGYWLYCFGSLQDVVHANLNLTGENLFEHPFWQQASRFLPYLALPDFSAWVNYADTAYQGCGGSYFFHGLASQTGDPLAQWYGSELLRREGKPSWKNLVYYNPDIPEQPLTQEPTCRFFKSIHLASFRSDWSDDATYMFFKGGSNAWSHTHLDLNSFFLTSRGERLATEPGPEPYTLAYWHSIQPVVSTAHHNCIVVDGAQQRVPAQYAMSYDLEEAGDCYSRLSDHVSTDWLEMIRGDATTAYGDQLSRAWRDIVYLKPDVFVIFDDLAGHPVRAQRNFEWMLHSECELHDIEVPSLPLVSSPVSSPVSSHPLPETVGGLMGEGRPQGGVRDDAAEGRREGGVRAAIEARGTKASLFIQPLFPKLWEHKYVPGRTVPRADNKCLNAVSIRPYWHHKWNVDPTKSPFPHWDQRGDCEPLFDNNCQYLIVLSAVASGQPPPYTLEPLQSGAAKGVRLHSEQEDFIVLFNPSGEAVELAGLQTDAEKLVLRLRGDAVDHVAIGGKQVIWRGKPLSQGA